MKYKNVNDYEQLYLISENDEEANRVMYEKYKPIIYSFAYQYYKIVKKYDVDVEELVQEGYIGLSNAINKYKDNTDANFYTFATVCIERSIQSFCRKYKTIKAKKLSNKISIDSDDEILNIELREDETTDVNPNAYLEKKNYNDMLINFKHSLSNRASMVFELRYNGFNNKEICSLLDLSYPMIEKCVREIKEKGVNYLNK